MKRNKSHIPIMKKNLTLDIDTINKDADRAMNKNNAH